MPTKQELEAEVEQLKSQLAAASPDLSAVQAELDQLKADLDAVSDERDQLKGLLDDVTADRDAQSKLVTVANGDAKAWKKKYDDLAAGTGGSDDDHVFLDGEKHDIIWRSTVKDMVYEGYHKRNVPEDATAIVVRKTGG